MLKYPENESSNGMTSHVMSCRYTKSSSLNKKTVLNTQVEYIVRLKNVLVGYMFAAQSVGAR